MILKTFTHAKTCLIVDYGSVSLPADGRSINRICRLEVKGSSKVSDKPFAVERENLSILLIPATNKDKDHTGKVV